MYESNPIIIKKSWTKRSAIQNWIYIV